MDNIILNYLLYDIFYLTILCVNDVIDDAPNLLYIVFCCITIIFILILFWSTNLAGDKISEISMMISGHRISPVYCEIISWHCISPLYTKIISWNHISPIYCIPRSYLDIVYHVNIDIISWHRISPVYSDDRYIIILTRAFKVILFYLKHKILKGYRWYILAMS